MKNRKIQKYLSETFNYIETISKAQTYTGQVGRTTKHSFNAREFEIEVVDDNFTFKTNTLIKAGVQDGKELKVKKETEVHFSNSINNLYVKGKGIIVNKVEYPDFDNLPMVKSLSGIFNSVSTKPNSFYTPLRRYRMIIPLTKDVRLMGDFTGWVYAIDGRSTIETLLKILVNGNEFHFFVVKDKNKKNYFVVDSMSSLPLYEFQKIVNSILLSYALLKGDYHGTRAYIFTYNTVQFKTPSSMLFYALGGGIYGGFQLHTTNPYWLMDYKKQVKYRKGKDGMLKRVDRKDIRNFMVEFPQECFGKLCELMCSTGGVLRTVILFVSNHNSPLEIKIPTLFVALENITRVLNGSEKSIPQIIEDKAPLMELKSIVKEAIKQIETLKRKYSPKEGTPEEIKMYNSNYARLTGKLNNLNAGTNNKKLHEPFEKHDYTLTKEEEELIYKQRNIFLHGSDYMSLDVNYEEEFRELFHMSLRLQKLIAVLLLKASGYSGYILNNARIYDDITEKYLSEDIFVKI